MELLGKIAHVGRLCRYYTVTTVRVVAMMVRERGGGLAGLARTIGQVGRLLIEEGPVGLYDFMRIPAARLRALDRQQDRVAAITSSGRPMWVESSPPAPTPHSLDVDIVICVHNALEEVKACLGSVLRFTPLPYRLVLVDDGSDEATRVWLEAFAEAQQAVLVRHDQPAGYTRAANRGMRATSAPLIVLLNSDTLVGPDWLDRLAHHALRDEEVGLVGPLSNTASWQSVPRIFDEEGDWAANPLPAGVGVDRMSNWVAMAAGRVSPELPLLNGFCLLLRREVLDEVGLFDEAAFPEGYGEENDLCLRAGAAGWRCVVADDVFVWHHQSRSYGHERRQALAKRADRVLRERYGADRLAVAVEQCRDNPPLEGARVRVAAMVERRRLAETGRRRWEGLRIAFVLPVTEAGGGANVVFQEAAALIAMGVDAWIINYIKCKRPFDRAYPATRAPVLFVPDDTLPGDELGSFDAVVATLFSSVRPVHDLGARHPRIRLANYIQDFEADFFPENSPLWHEAMSSYDLARGMRCLTKTRWNRDQLRRVGIEARVLGPSVDLDLFRPRRPPGQRWPNQPLHIGAMVRPSTPRRNAALTLGVLGELARRFGESIRVSHFGVAPKDPAFKALGKVDSVEARGLLAPQQVAAYLSELDIFLDLSSYQAMGLTALEAMATGVAVVLPERGGTHDIAHRNHEALFVDTSSRDACLAAATRLIEDHALRRALARAGHQRACSFMPERAALRLLEALFDEPTCGGAPP